MNLISCDNCGVVLDKDKLKFPKDVYLEGDCLDLTKCAWDGNDYVPCTPCPVCREPVLETKR